MSLLILIRHGQSIWNSENRFTGWVDIDLTKKGESEAEKAGLLIKEKNIEINFYYSSLQLRANNTLRIIQKVLNDEKSFVRAWQLNERHYGALTGLNKAEMSKKIGEKKFINFGGLGISSQNPLIKKVYIIQLIFTHIKIYLNK